MTVEGWTFVEGMYFGFVASTTIGFGDYMSSPLRTVKTNIQQALAGNRTSSDGVTDTTFWHPTDIVRGIIYLFVLILDYCLASNVVNSAVAAVEEWKSQPPQCLGCIQSRKSGNARFAEKEATLLCKEISSNYKGKPMQVFHEQVFSQLSTKLQ